MKKIIVNMQTREQTLTDLTAKEMDEITANQALPPPVPQFVTMRQARLALLSAGLLSQVNDAIQTMKDASGDVARIEWEYAGMVDRNWPLVTSLGLTLGLTDKQVDDLFVLAATL